MQDNKLCAVNSICSCNRYGFDESRNITCTRNAYFISTILPKYDFEFF